MEFRQDGDNMGGGGGGFASGLTVGSMMNRREDNHGSYIWAIIIFAIIFIIAIIALVLMCKDNKGNRDGTDIAALLAPIIAAKSMDSNNNGYDHDHLEIKNQIAQSEDRREMSGIKSELGAVALMMQKTASDNEKDNLKEFGEIKAVQAMQSEALKQLLTAQNNTAIINGVYQQLMMSPRLAC